MLVSRLLHRAIKHKSTSSKTYIILQVKTDKFIDMSLKDTIISQTTVNNIGRN